MFLLILCFVCCFVFVGFGGPGGGFGAPGGGFSDNRSSGKPLLLLRLKKHPQGSISTKFRPYTSDWFRVMTKKLKKLTSIKLTSIKF